VLFGFKGLIPTFGLLQWVNMIKECLPKVGIKPLKISCQNIIPCFLTFCSRQEVAILVHTQSLLTFAVISVMMNELSFYAEDLSEEAKE